MEMRILRILTLGLALVFVIGGVSLVKAQEYDEYTLEEITVTAQKREENQQKVPIAMEVISGEEMREKGLNNIDDILMNISSAIVNKTDDGYRISIRGISDDQRMMDSLSPSTPTVSLNKDGIYSSRKDAGLELYDIERVEVLIGPQSTLYSSNSPAGVVNVVTAQPKFDKYELTGLIEYGDYNLMHTEGSMNAPINDKFALRGAFSSSKRDGYLSNGSDDEDVRSARIKLLYKPIEAISFLITGEGTRNGGRGFGHVAPFTDQNDLNDPWYTELLGNQPRDQIQKKIYANIDLNLSFATVTIMPAYSTRNGTAERHLLVDNEDMTTWDTSSGFEKGIEVRAVSPSDSDMNIKWILGANYFDSEDKMYAINSFGSYRDMKILAGTKAIYGNITYAITDIFRVTGGIRKSWDESSTYIDETRRNPVTGINEPALTIDDKEVDLPDYKLGVEYDLGENSMLYADYSTSYRSQGWYSADEPEKLFAYSLGSKNRFLGNKLQLNVSSFLYAYENYNARNMKFDPETGFPVRALSDSKATARMSGVDVQLSAIITRQDELNVSVSYLVSVFDDLYYVWDHPTLPPEDWSGKPMTNSPKYTISANYSHGFNLPNGGVLTTRIESAYKTKYIVAWQELASGMDIRALRNEKAHHISNISAIYAHPDGNWTLTGYMKNIENYAEKRMLMMMATSGNLSIGEPRTYGAILSVRY